MKTPSKEKRRLIYVTDCSFKTNLKNNPASDVTGNPPLPSVFPNIKRVIILKQKHVSENVSAQN